MMMYYFFFYDDDARARVRREDHFGLGFEKKANPFCSRFNLSMFLRDIDTFNNNKDNFE